MSKRRGRGEGSVQLLDDGRWRVEVSQTVNGKRRRRVAYGKTKAEALEQLRRLQGERGTSGAGRLTLGAWLTTWQQSKRATVAAGTAAFYERACRLHLVPFLGTYPLQRLNAAAVRAAFVAMESANVTADQRRKAMTTLRAALNDAVADCLIPANPARGVAKAKVDQAEMRALTEDEARAFLATAKGDRLYALFVLWLDTGAREGELLGLHWPDVDLLNGTVFIRQALEEVNGERRLKAPKTKSSRRRVLISPATTAALAAHLEALALEGQDTENGLVFPTLRRQSFLWKSDVHRTIHKICDAAGIKRFRPYDLRHTCATLLLARDVNIRVVSDRLGHSDITTTLRHYAHCLPSMQAKAVQAISDILEPLKMGTQLGTQNKCSVNQEMS